MIPTAVVIPTRYDRDRFDALYEVIRPETDLVYIMDNGHEPSIDVAVDARGKGLYEMWNLGVSLARRATNGYVNIAVLNDDIRILPGTLAMLAEALRSQRRLGAVYPDIRTKLSAGLPATIEYETDWDPKGPRHLTGFAFMFKGELDLPPFDEGYEWWYGDTQFDESVRLAGYGVAKVLGLPIEHHSDAEANGWSRRPELREATERDGLRWAQLHDRIEDGRWVPR